MRARPALLALALAACGRAPTETAPSPSALAAPESSTATIASPLAREATGYTNEMQAESLRQQAAELGIEKLGPPTDKEEEEARPPISYEEGLARTRAYATEFQAERHALDRDKVKNVTLPGETPRDISSPGAAAGAPLPSGPEDPDAK